MSTRETFLLQQMIDALTVEEADDLQQQTKLLETLELYALENPPEGDDIEPDEEMLLEQLENKVNTEEINSLFYAILSNPVECGFKDKYDRLSTLAVHLGINQNNIVGDDLERAKSAIEDFKKGQKKVKKQRSSVSSILQALQNTKQTNIPQFENDDPNALFVTLINHAISNYRFSKEKIPSYREADIKAILAITALDAIDAIDANDEYIFGEVFSPSNSEKISNEFDRAFKTVQQNEEVDEENKMLLALKKQWLIAHYVSQMEKRENSKLIPCLGAASQAFTLIANLENIEEENDEQFKKNIATEVVEFLRHSSRYNRYLAQSDEDDEDTVNYIVQNFQAILNEGVEEGYDIYFKDNNSNMQLAVRDLKEFIIQARMNQQKGAKDEQVQIDYKLIDLLHGALDSYEKTTPDFNKERRNNLCFLRQKLREFESDESIKQDEEIKSYFESFFQNEYENDEIDGGKFTEGLSSRLKETCNEAIAYFDNQKKEGQGNQTITRNISARTWAPEEPNGEVVLLVHGLGDSLKTWNQRVQALLAQGYTVVAYDQAGHGRDELRDGKLHVRQMMTDLSKMIKYAYEMANDTENVENVNKIHVEGHSMAGAMLAASLEDLRGDKRIASLTLHQPAAQDTNRFAAHLRQEMGAEKNTSNKKIEGDKTRLVYEAGEQTLFRGGGPKLGAFSKNVSKLFRLMLSAFKKLKKDASTLDALQNKVIDKITKRKGTTNLLK